MKLLGKKHNKRECSTIHKRFTEGIMERENQRIAITKRLLKESMLRLLEVKELDKINVTELCREAGINRVTFYRHYEMPRDVLYEIGKDLYQGMRQAIHVPKSDKEIRSCIEKLCAYLSDHADVLRILIRCNTDYYFFTFINDIYMEIWNELGQLKIVRDLKQEDAKLLTTYCAGGSYYALKHWLMGNTQKTAQEMAEYICTLLKKTDWVMVGGHLNAITE